MELELRSSTEVELAWSHSYSPTEDLTLNAEVRHHLIDVSFYVASAFDFLLLKQNDLKLKTEDL